MFFGGAIIFSLGFEGIHYASLGVLGFYTISKRKVNLKQAHCQFIKGKLILNPYTEMLKLKNRLSSYQNRKIEIGEHRGLNQNRGHTTHIKTHIGIRIKQLCLLWSHAVT